MSRWPKRTARRCLTMGGIRGNVHILNKDDPLSYHSGFQEAIIMALEAPVARGGLTDAVATASLSRARTRLLQRIAAGEPGLAQIWFRASVLDRYRGIPGCQLFRTNTVGCVRGADWRVDFGISGDANDQEPEVLVHICARDLFERVPTSERAHWISHAVTLPASANFLAMQSTRGACIDDGDLRSW